MDDPDEIARLARVHDYVTGKLGPDEQDRFEQEMAGDPSLRDAVEMERLLQATLHQEKELRFRDMVREASAQLDAEEDTSVISMGRRRWVWWAAAACVVGLLGFGMVQWLTRTTDRGHAIAFAEATVPKSRDTTEISPYSDDPRLNTVLDVIRAGRFEEALALLDTTAPLRRETACEADWLRGLALLGMGRQAAAEPMFDRVLAAQCYPEAGLARELKAKR